MARASPEKTCEKAYAAFELRVRKPAEEDVEEASGKADTAIFSSVYGLRMFYGTVSILVTDKNQIWQQLLSKQQLFFFTHMVISSFYIEH